MLSPAIVETVLKGQQRATMTIAELLVPAPMEWCAQQHTLLGPACAPEEAYREASRRGFEIVLSPNGPSKSVCDATAVEFVAALAARAKK
jgi:hypothetical protein